MEECIDMKKMWYLHIKEYFSVLKKKGILVICYHIDEISQSQKAEFQRHLFGNRVVLRRFGITEKQGGLSDGRACL